jgi:hypothetical protein
MTPAKEITSERELLALADLTENAKPSWLPISGHVVNVTYSLNQREIVAKALRLLAVRDAPVAWRSRHINGSKWAYHDTEPAHSRHRAVEPLYTSSATPRPERCAESSALGEAS